MRFVSLFSRALRKGGINTVLILCFCVHSHQKNMLCWILNARGCILSIVDEFVRFLVFACIVEKKRKYSVLDPKRVRGF